MFIELPKFRKKLEELETDLDKCLYALCHIKELQKMPSTYTGSSFELLFRTAELAKFSKEEQKMIDAAQKAKWDAYAIQSYREKEDARIREETARLRAEKARVHAEAARQEQEEARLQKEAARQEKVEARLREENVRIQQEAARQEQEAVRLQEERDAIQQENERLQKEKLQLAKRLKKNGVPLSEIANSFQISQEELEQL